jgi:hypothetical protein
VMLPCLVRPLAFWLCLPHQEAWDWMCLSLSINMCFHNVCQRNGLCELLCVDKK